MSTPDQPGPPVPPHEKRASDDDRRKVAESLRVALDEGRLDLNEYDERLQGTYASKTYAELNALLADIPGTAPLEKSRIEPAAEPVRPVFEDHGSRRRDCRRTRWSGRRSWGGLGGVAILLTGIWLMQWIASGDGAPNFWPAWIIGFWAIAAACSSWSRFMKD